MKIFNTTETGTIPKSNPLMTTSIPFSYLYRPQVAPTSRDPPGYHDHEIMITQADIDDMAAGHHVRVSFYDYFDIQSPYISV